MKLLFSQNSNNKLDHYPESVEEFVDHLTFLQKIQSDMAALEKEFGIVTRLFTLIKDFEVPIHAEHQALFQTLGPSFQSLKVIIMNCVIFQFASRADSCSSILVHNFVL